MAAAPAVQVARLYQLPPDHDGSWVLVVRLWPRGLRQDDAPIPGPELQGPQLQPVLSFNGR